MIEAKSLSKTPFRHGFFTREGGVSQGIYASLNCGLGSKDDTGDVIENRRRVAERLGVESGFLISPYQYHSTEVVTVDEPWTRETAPRADAVVTNRPGLAIGVSTADCVPVLFADPDAGVTGATHAGWRGALSGVLEATLEAMTALGAKPSRVTAAIGPAISRDAYEVGEEFRQTFIDEDPDNERFFGRRSDGGRPYFDLTGYVAARLERQNLAHVEDVAVCTYAPENGLFSYRRSVHRGEPDYGRQISAILIA